MVEAVWRAEENIAIAKVEQLRRPPWRKLFAVCNDSYAAFLVLLPECSQDAQQQQEDEKSNDKKRPRQYLVTII